MCISFVNFHPNWWTKIFATLITRNFLAMNVHHMPPVTRIISELSTTNVTGIPFDVRMGQNVFFEDVGCVETLATNFTHMSPIHIWIFVTSNRMHSERSSSVTSKLTLVASIGFFASVTPFVKCQISSAWKWWTTVFTNVLKKRICKNIQSIFFNAYYLLLFRDTALYAVSTCQKRETFPGNKCSQMAENKSR